MHVPRNSSFDILFEPIRLGPKMLPNRFWQVPHCMGAGSDQPGFQAEFRGMKAEGGWGAVFTEATSISPEADTDPYVLVNLWDHGDVRNLSLMCERVHEHGSLAGIELYYGTTASNLSRMPARAPSQMVSELNSLGSAKVISKTDIRVLRQMYVDAAIRARAAGFDLITLYAAFADTLLATFLIPMYNHRSDEYGGSFENRARFAREVCEAVREAVGDDCAVGIRFGIDTLPAPYGLGEDGIAARADGHRFIALMDDLVDYWDLCVATAAHAGEDIAPSRTHAENHERPYVQDVKRHTSKPVVNVGRFTSPDTMVKLIRDGQCDIVGAARPSIADPFLPTKLREGRLDEIRECIGCNICISKWEQGGPRIVCTQNATSGEEFRRGWHPERFKRAANRDNDVLIVGAGPAGMECGMVLGKRGMRRVHLVDSEAELGGCLRWIPELPGLGEWRRVVNYRQIQLKKLKNVEFIPRLRLDADAVLEYGAEIVIVATGSHWVGDGRSGAHIGPLPGADATLEHVLTPEQVMVEGKPSGPRVVVFDAEGYFMGHELATKLAGDGHEVTFVTPHEVIAPYTRYTLEMPRVNRGLRELGVAVHTGSVLTAVSGKAATVRSVWSDDHEIELPSDSVVLVTQRFSDDALFAELSERTDDLAAAGIGGVYQVGDCVAPDRISEAIFSGHRLAREIDSENPAVALPFMRERRIVGATDADYVLGSPIFGSDVHELMSGATRR